ncbi:MAG: hypothetical protein R3C32_08615 [Chloroflexota bacterium]
MSVVVINKLRLSVSVDELAPRVAEAAFPPAFDATDGFERFNWSRWPTTRRWCSSTGVTVLRPWRGRPPGRPCSTT